MISLTKLAILGSTGSIGINTLDVVRAHSNRLQISALAAARNWALLAKQVREFKPRLAVLFNTEHLEAFRETVKGVDVAVRSGMAGLLEVARDADSDTLISAVVGSIGLRPVLEAIDTGKRICLANKETLVVGGAIVMEAARIRKVPIIPIDSEHSAIFQCLYDRNRERVLKLILTASGGPFRLRPRHELAGVTPEEALKHPNWDMGGKITIDSATLMNKGLEVIEAHWLFELDFDRIEVLIHPQSIIHSMVEFIDGSIISQMGAPDMRGPIQFALSHPDRWGASGNRLDLLKIGPLTFDSPRMADFPCLGFAYEAGRKGGNLPCIMNAANEIAVELFLKHQIGFTHIPAIVRKCMDTIPFHSSPGLTELEETDQKARLEARRIGDSLGKAKSA